MLSDLLLELNHYEWILGILMDFTQDHPIEDEILMQYLIPTVCKALAVLKLVNVIFLCKLCHYLNNAFNATGKKNR